MKTRAKQFKAGEVMKALKRIGFTADNEPGRVKILTNRDGMVVSLPSDPHELLLPRLLEWVLRDARLSEKEFRRLLKSS